MAGEPLTEESTNGCFWVLLIIYFSLLGWLVWTEIAPHIVIDL